ncbi:2440_t:CDS:2 [Acaulospora colombiana]|uniref:2440_t:CDS:1 n=1 Tax=Acaulospora colombiana TaxID=27376 RepID=A0ACA9KRH6_9GLOM|nr:2440_t:CDS:2 [Acaulospora colombiana]
MQLGSRDSFDIDLAIEWLVAAGGVCSFRPSNNRALSVKHGVWKHNPHPRCLLICQRPSNNIRAWHGTAVGQLPPNVHEASTIRSENGDLTSSQRHLCPLETLIDLMRGYMNSSSPNSSPTSPSLPDGAHIVGQWRWVVTVLHERHLHKEEHEYDAFHSELFTDIIAQLGPILHDVVKVCYELTSDERELDVVFSSFLYLSALQYLNRSMVLSQWGKSHSTYDLVPQGVSVELMATEEKMMARQSSLSHDPTSFGHATSSEEGMLPLNWLSSSLSPPISTVPPFSSSTNGLRHDSVSGILQAFLTTIPICSSSITSSSQA